MRAALLAGALACAACSGKAGAPAAPPKDGASVRVPDNARQLLTVITRDWGATDAEINLYERPAGQWQLAGPSWRATIGKTGLAWGRGLHGEGAPAGRSGPIKHEGDGKSPAGMFAIGPAFGYAASAPSGTKMPYTPVDEHWRCVDDAASAVYNRVLDERTVEKDWASAEDMKRPDELYTWVVEVKHNAAATPGGGSCIFLHVWGGPGDTTVGCTAMDESRLAWLIAALDPAANPVIVQLPAAEYDALGGVWELPTNEPR